MKISVVIVSWNVKDKLRENLLALKQSESLDGEIIVVDNDSQDGTVEMLKAEFLDIIIIANQENKGFAKASNQGIKKAVGKNILLLNPDMRVFPETLHETLAWLDEHPEAAITGIRLVDEAHQTIKQVRRFPRLLDQAVIASKLAHLWPGILNKYLREDFDYDRPSKVDSIRGSFFLIRRSTIETIGLLDERFFVWFEEVDYCRRAASAGLEVWYTPVATAVDYIGQSFRQLDVNKTQKYFRRSMMAYFKKWQPLWQVIILQIAWFLGFIVVILARIFKAKPRART